MPSRPRAAPQAAKPTPGSWAMVSRSMPSYSSITWQRRMMKSPGMPKILSMPISASWSRRNRARVGLRSGRRSLRREALTFVGIFAGCLDEGFDDLEEGGAMAGPSIPPP